MSITLDIVENSYRYLNLNTQFVQEIKDEFSNVSNQCKPRTYHHCNIKSWNHYDNGLKTDKSIDFFNTLSKVYKVDNRSTGYYQFFEGDFLQPHVDKHDSYKGDYYTLLIPVMGLGVVKCYKENKDLENPPVVQPFYDIMDMDKQFTEIAQIDIDRPTLFRPTEIIHAAIPVVTPRVVWQTRFYEADYDINTAAKHVEERLNVEYSFR